MIDEKKLVEKLNKITFKAEVRNSGYKGTRTEKMLCYGDVMSIINKQPKVGEWIPCSERLPESEGVYLVTTKIINKKEVVYAFYSQYLRGFVCNGNAIAWQPLPEPYQGGREE